MLRRLAEHLKKCLCGNRIHLSLVHIDAKLRRKDEEGGALITG